MRLHSTHGVAAAAICVFFLAACGSSKSDTSPAPELSTTIAAGAATSQAGDATSSTTTTGNSSPDATVQRDSPTTVAPPSPTAPGAADTTSTVTPTTATPSPSPGGGWTVIDPGTVGAPLAYPCCAETWHGDASPPLPMGDEPLSDGIYRVEFEWPTQFGGPIAAEVKRFERCEILPPGSCEDNGGYRPTDLGIDDAVSQPLTLPLDGTLRVVLGGYTSDGVGNFKVGTGADLAELLTALDSDYQAAVAEPALAGMGQVDIANALTSAPAHGFAPLPANDYSGALLYTHGDAPPLLFQTLFNNDARDPVGARGSDLVGRIALLVQNGQLTLTTYAGFYS